MRFTGAFESRAVPRRACSCMTYVIVVSYRQERRVAVINIRVEDRIRDQLKNLADAEGGSR